jgi:hypothetical protein
MLASSIGITLLARGIKPSFLGAAKERTRVEIGNMNPNCRSSPYYVLFPNSSIALANEASPCEATRKSYDVSKRISPAVGRCVFVLRNEPGLLF